MDAVTVITGGAGGMGLAAAKIVGRRGQVVIADVSGERLDTATAELKASGIVCSAVRCDITDRDSVAALVETARAGGSVRSVIHTAGVSPSMGPAESIMRVNAVGTVNINEAFLPLAGEGFAIVNVASMAAHMLPSILVPARRFALATRNPEAFLPAMISACRIAPPALRPGLAYSISKRFVVWYSAKRAGEFGRRGARIVSVSPGSIDTDMGRLEKQTGSAAMAEHAALRRFGTAEEVAEVLAFCAGENAGYLTGVDILCDGGTVASMTLRDKLSAARST
ncbi:SDR family oxidoreductase [Nocardia testacea]|uniref:SDR family oxidoreductase n=1 Tax=Nocardia testacea TaxID=248551 RepID=UPI003A8C884F